MEILSDYQISVIRQVWVLLIVLFAISTFYLIKTKSILQSAHGYLVLLAFAYAVIACRYTEFDPDYQWYWPVYFFFWASLASMLYSLKAFKGKKVIHLIHAATIFSNLLVNFIALMAISHDWI